MTLEQARALLADSAWLGAFSPGLRDDFLARTRLLPPFQRGQRVFHLGDKADGIYGVVSGCFGFEIAVEDGGPSLAHHLRPGDWFGELAHVIDSPRLTSIYALEPSQCLRIGAAELAGLSKTEPLLWKHLALSLANDLVVAMTAIHDLMERSPRKRMASTLLRLAGLRIQGKRQGQDSVTSLKLTHEQLAQMTNLSRGLVAQTLNELEQQGHLKSKYGRIHLTDPTALREWLRSSQHSE